MIPSSSASLAVAHMSVGRFWHFDLARQLHARNMLAHFFIAYPRWVLRGEGIPLDKVTTFPWFQTPRMAMARYGVEPARLIKELEWLTHWTLDDFVARNLPEADVIVALSGSGARTAKAATARGIRFVCDRGSTHIRVQEQILDEEFARWGERFPGIDQRKVEQEEREYELADLITVPSGFVLDTFLERGIPAEKMRKVPFGVDLRRFEKVAEPDPERFTVLFVGGVTLRKGIPDLLEAFARFKHPRKELRIVGGPDPLMRRRLARQGLPEGVTLVGRLPQPRLKEEMSRAHVMVLPSLEEGLAMVQAQALACGCPVIATPNTGCEDLFTDGIEGFVVPARDPEAIARRLEELADDPARRQRMSEAALARVGQIGGWDAYGDELVAALRSLTAR